MQVSEIQLKESEVQRDSCNHVILGDLWNPGERREGRGSCGYYVK